jgi:uncharacterized protein with PQ loop repeat
LAASLAGMCCAPIGIGGIVLGLVALSQIQASAGTQSGRDAAIAAIVIGAITLVLWLAVAAG